MAYAFINNTAFQSTDTNTITSSSIDTSGSDTIFVVVSWYTGVGGGAVLTDSKGNTWNGLTERSNGFDLRQRVYYAKNATAGTGHTFTLTGTVSLPAGAVSAFSGGHLTAPFDQEVFANISSTSGQPGSLTPSENDCIVISGQNNQDANGSVATIDSGFTKTDSVDRATSGLGVGSAYLIQTTAAAVNPTWSWSSSNNNLLTSSSFKKAAGGGGGATGHGALLRGVRNVNLGMLN
jgi:hypothetical protein